MRVRDVMTSDPLVVGPNTPFKEIIDVLVEHRIGGLPVVDDNGELVGIVTETDLITKAAFADQRRGAMSVVGALLAGRDPNWLKKASGLEAGKVMTRRVVTAEPNEDVHVAARRLLEHRVGRLPVVQEGRLVGIVSRSDLLRPFHRSDDIIAADIGAKLADRVVLERGHNVSFSVSAGVVTLVGTVEFPRDVETVEAMAKAVPGVVAVQNEVTATLPESDRGPVIGPDFDRYGGI
jgi:CBS domain-containing protein